MAIRFLSGTWLAALVCVAFACPALGQQVSQDPPATGTDEAPQPSATSVGELFPAFSAVPSAEPEDFWGRLDVDKDLMKNDFKNFYSPINLLEVGAGIGVAAPLANTSADESIRRWYQHHVHQASTINMAANIFSYGCEAWAVVPAGIEGMGLAGWLNEDYANDGGWGEWSNRSLRSMAIGTPTLLATYVILGAGRPSSGDSHWHPFQDVHGASGHTFYGAIPFLTAAEMTDNPWLETPLFLASFATGWARIHKDQHYFSQVVLGWWLAYLSVRRVDDTNTGQHPHWSFSPMTSEGPGVGVEFHF